jgi:hypothetical protein
MGMFDRVTIVACGPRPDKPTTNDIDPVHRAAMSRRSAATGASMSIWRSMMRGSRSSWGRPDGSRSP